MQHHGPDREDADEALVMIILCIGTIIGTWYMLGKWCGLPLLIVFLIALFAGWLWK
jgi:hypothetical protein